MVPATQSAELVVAEVVYTYGAALDLDASIEIARARSAL